MSDSDGRLNWLREDLRDIKKGVVNLNDRLTIHENNCPARDAFLNPPVDGVATIKSPNISFWLNKAGPLILAAALGLIGIGAYVGGNKDFDSLREQVEHIRKIVEKVQK